jgi:hypothetical protein
MKVLDITAMAISQGLGEMACLDWLGTGAFVVWVGESVGIRRSCWQLGLDASSREVILQLKSR